MTKRRRRLLADPLTRDQVLALAGCPRCGAPAGQPCVRPRTDANHRERVRAASGARFVAGLAELEATGRLPSWVR